ncbi:hypothetical protein BGZ49_001251 [Haplosporangium sp. Z 27]|nr:hypothetical protein BGZ49_001251 [Haplosporangium sp. Z 27]
MAFTSTTDQAMTSATNILKLSYVIDGNLASSASLIEISSDETVGLLREEIFKKNRVKLRVNDAVDLRLWFVNISAKEKKPITVSDSTINKKLLMGGVPISKYFDNGASMKTIHIIAEDLRVSERRFVQYVPGPILPFQGMASESPTTTTRAHSITPSSITEWSDFIDNVNSMQLSQDPLYAMPAFCEERRFSTDEDILEFFKRDVGLVSRLPPFANTFRCPGMNYGLPDLICLEQGGNVHNRHTILFPIEIKQPRELNIAGSLHDAITQQLLSGHVTGPLDIVRQIFGYMLFNGFRYGILSTFNHTWFIIRPQDDIDSIKVSPAISFDDTNPTILSCYLWFIRQVQSDKNSNLDPVEQSEIKRILKLKRKVGAKRRKQSKGSLKERLPSAMSPRFPFISRRSSTHLQLADNVDIVPACQNMELIAVGGRARVFRALWKGKAVIVKKCDMWNERQYIDALANEIEINNILQALQGIWIPKMRLGGIMNGFEIVLVTKYAGVNISNCHLTLADCNKIRDALTAIHNCGILHGDIKPDNIVVERNGIRSRFMIIDFGLSRITNNKKTLQNEQDELDSILAMLSQP